MPGFLLDVEIDWGWPQLSESERAIARRHEALLQADRKAYTVDTAEQALAAAARELPGRLLRARAVDDEHAYCWQVIEGEIYDGHEFDEAGVFPGELTADDFKASGVANVLTPIVFPDSMMREIEARGRHHDGSLSALVQGAWQAAADELPAGFRTPGGPRHIRMGCIVDCRDHSLPPTQRHGDGHSDSDQRD